MHVKLEFMWKRI